MADSHSTRAPECASPALQLAALSDGDAATAAGPDRRAGTTVADATRAAISVELHHRLTEARTWEQELAILATAVRYDQEHPDELPLADELHGRMLLGSDLAPAA